MFCKYNILHYSSDADQERFVDVHPKTAAVVPVENHSTQHSIRSVSRELALEQTYPSRLKRVEMYKFFHCSNTRSFAQ